jgi:predicted extracellular nuclease
MRTWKFSVLVALVAGLFMAAGCTRAKDDETDDKKTEDVTPSEDSQEPVDEDVTEPPEDNVGPTPDNTVTPPEECGAVDLTVADLQQREEGLNCTPPAQGENGFINLDQDARLNGLVVTTGVHDMTEKLEGFYASDLGGGPYSGMKVVMDKGLAPDVQIGDIVSMTGDLKEYYCLTEFEPADVDIFDNTGAPAPTKVTMADFTADPEKWEGVLIEIADAKVLEHDNYGGFLVEGDLTIDDAIFGDMTPAEVGCVYAKIVGVVDYGYGSYKLYPRFADDLVLAAGDCETVEPSVDTISDIQKSDESLTCSGAAFNNVGPVSVEGVIVATPRYVVSKDKLHGFFVSDGIGGPYSGVLVVTNVADDVQLAVGEVIDLEADWTEYYCMTELQATKITETGENKAGDLKVQDVSADDLTDNSEQFEGVVVKLADVEVLSDIDQYGEYVVTGDITIKHKFEGIEYEPAIGDTITVSGPVEYSFEKYKIMPTGDDDIIVQ